MQVIKISVSNWFWTGNWWKPIVFVEPETFAHAKQKILNRIFTLKKMFNYILSIISPLPEIFKVGGAQIQKYKPLEIFS